MQLSLDASSGLNSSFLLSNIFLLFLYSTEAFFIHSFRLRPFPFVAFQFFKKSNHLFGIFIKEKSFLKKMCKHEWLDHGWKEVCKHCGLEGPNKLNGIVPQYGPRSFSRRFEPYSRPLRFAELLHRLRLSFEEENKVMTLYGTLHENWRRWEEKTSRYIFNRKVCLSYLCSLVFKTTRVAQLKNKDSEKKQVEQMKFLLEEFKYEPPKKKETLWDLFDG